MKLSSLGLWLSLTASVHLGQCIPKQETHKWPLEVQSSHLSWALSTTTTTSPHKSAPFQLNKQLNKQGQYHFLFLILWRLPQTSIQKDAVFCLELVPCWGQRCSSLLLPNAIRAHAVCFNVPCTLLHPRWGCVLVCRLFSFYSAHWLPQILKCFLHFRELGSRQLSPCA